MADDLEEFLKQAALRRQQRQQQQSRGAKEPIVQQRPQASAPPPRLQPQVNIPDAVVVEPNKPYEPTIGSLSTSLPSSMPTLGQSEPRISSQNNDTNQRELGNLRQSEQKPSNKKKAKKETQQPRLAETAAAPAEVQPTAKVSSASLIAQLRDPQSLRMAIIAHEILKRPWQ